MSPEIHRKIKAFLILGILSVSEGRRMSMASLFNDSFHGKVENVVHGSSDDGPKHTTTETAAMDALQAVLADPQIQKDSKLFAEEIDAMLTAPKLQELGRLASEHLKAITGDPGLQGHSKLLADQMSALALNVQGQYKVVTDQLGNVLDNPNLQEHAKLASEQLSAIMDHLRLSQQSKRLAEQLEAMKTGPSVKEQLPQEHVKVLSESLKAIRGDPEFRKRSKLFADQSNSIIIRAEVKERAHLASEELKAITEDQDFKGRVQLVSEQLKAIIEHPMLQQHSKLFAQEIEAAMTDLEVKERVDIAAEQLEAIMTNPAMQKLSKLFGMRFEAMAVDPSTEANSSQKIKPRNDESSSLAEVREVNGQKDSMGRFFPAAARLPQSAAIPGRPYIVGHTVGVPRSASFPAVAIPGSEKSPLSVAAMTATNDNFDSSKPGQQRTGEAQQVEQDSAAEEGAPETIRVRIWQALASGEELSLQELSKAVGVNSFGDLRSHLRHVERQASTLGNKSEAWRRRRGLPEALRTNRLRLQKRHAKKSVFYKLS